MSSNSGKNVVRTFKKRGFPSNCVCGAGVTIYTSKTKDNPGRPFHRCESKKDDHLFKWVEESVLEEVEDALPKLEKLEEEVHNIKCDGEVMKDVILEVKEDIIELKTDFRKWKIAYVSCILLLVIVIVYLLV